MNDGETKPFDGNLGGGKLGHEVLMNDMCLVVARNFVSLIWI